MGWRLYSLSLVCPSDDSFSLLSQVLYLKEVDTMLALVCITRSENFRKKSLIDYNIGCLKKALQALILPAPLVLNGNHNMERVAE